MSKKKILLLSDDMRMTSGIATMSKEIVLGTVKDYDWVQLGSGINHPEAGKIVDLNEDVRIRTGVEDASVKIYPYNGYGDMQILRKLIKEEKPDGILFFTDPHYWAWLFENEHEIRQTVPLMYYHIWDNTPDPLYNRNFYESCDWLGCISKLTYGIVNRVGKLETSNTWKPLEDWQVTYVPHGINQGVFKPLDSISDNVKKYVHGDKEYEFVLFFNNRNIRRKQPSDVMYAYRLFCDMLPKESAEKCLLLMHTAPIDQNGTDLYAVKEAVCPNYDVKYITNKVEQDMLNEFYNISDCTINIANNEGFGLTTVESIMAGTPIIVTVTGGLQDQCGFNFTADDYINIERLSDKKLYGSLEHGVWSYPVWPSATNINGSPITPYIFDDRVNDNEVAEAIHSVYAIGKKTRKKNGLVGREWAIKNLSAQIMCEKLKDGIEGTIKNFKPREKYNMYKVV
jgi:glycosyltransferase involved in cell wall biosynthesis